MKEDRPAKEHACLKQKTMLNLHSVKETVKTSDAVGLSYTPSLAKSGNNSALNNSLKILILRTFLMMKIFTGL